MQLMGVDFTSAPRPAKPIVCAVGHVSDAAERLVIERLEFFIHFTQFERWLSQSGPWIAAVDFPLGQPRRLIRVLGWPTDWTAYVRHVSRMTKSDFVTTLERYCRNQPVGDKHHFRWTDRVASACSPMMLYGVPVAKMFFEGAPRVEQAGVCVPPCRPSTDDRVVVEGYPARIARLLVGKQAYKTERARLAAVTSKVRRDLLGSLERRDNTELPVLVVTRDLKTHIINDYRGDALDAVLCTLQAAWCFQRRKRNYGIPGAVDPLEGWIAGYEWVEPTAPPTIAKTVASSRRHSSRENDVE